MVAGLYDYKKSQPAVPADNTAESQQHITTSDHQPLTNRLSYMAQTDQLLPWLTVIENVLISYRLKKKKVTPSVIASVKQLFIKLNLDTTIFTDHPNTLSGGMRQRVALARTLLTDNPVVLMDEPFANVDAITRYQLQALACNLLANHTVLLITHDPLEALRMADTIYVLRGKPATLTEIKTPTVAPLRDYNHPEVQTVYTQLLRELSGETENEKT